VQSINGANKEIGFPFPMLGERNCILDDESLSKPAFFDTPSDDRVSFGFCTQQRTGVRVARCMCISSLVPSFRFPGWPKPVWLLEPCWSAHGSERAANPGFPPVEERLFPPFLDKARENCHLCWVSAKEAAYRFDGCGELPWLAGRPERAKEYIYRRIHSIL